MVNQLFNLDKIKEITNPLEILQGNFDRLEVHYKKFLENRDNVLKSLRNEDFLRPFHDLTELIKKINAELRIISNENMSKFLIFQDELIRKYKEFFKETLKKISLDYESTKRIGLYLIENKEVSKIIDKTSFIFSITITKWLELLDSLKQNSLFLATIENVDNFYDKLLKKKLKIELSKIPENFSPKLIEDFKKRYLAYPITFNEYLKENLSNLPQEGLTTKKHLKEKTEASEELKEMQKKQLESYKDYIKLSDKEFKIKMRKKKREKLSDLVTEQEKTEQIQITEEISEKIEKFKLKFNSSFDERYLIKRDDEKDPLDIIRERKERKKKEYKDFIKKFENEEK